MNPKLQINPEYEKIIPPLSPVEIDELESNILEEGVIISPIIIWDGVIIDGHNRYRIAEKHPNISFSTFEKVFINDYEARAWICKNQLGRRNLTRQRHKYLVGLRYEFEKMANNRDAKGRFAPSGQNDRTVEIETTAEKIAKELGVGEATIRRSGKYAKGVDIAERLSPGIKNDILSNVIQVPSRVLETLPSMTESKQLDAIKQIKTNVKEILNGHSVEESVISSIAGASDMFKNSCNNHFSRHPTLLSNEEYRERIFIIFQDLKKYINHIQGETT